ncbi:fimbrial protein [Pseudomonas sp. HLT2-19-2]
MNKHDSLSQAYGLVALVVAGLIASPCVNATGMSFSGTLISAPVCTMTEKPMDIKFGLVDVMKVDSGRYEQPVEYTPKCVNTEHASQFYVSLAFKGDVSNFESSYLATDNVNLAIKVWDGTNVLAVNRSMLVYDITKFPALKAVLMKRPNANLSGGKFSATATLRIDVM